MRVRTRWPAAALAVLLLAACTVARRDPGPSGPDPPGDPTPTTLEAYDAAGTAVSRSPFCDRVSPTGIEHALGEAARSHRDHGNGDRVRLPDGTRTIAHEYGCEWRGVGGVVARAWVFVPPVPRGRARALVEEAVAGRCSRTGSGDFGSPSVATRCRTDEGVERSWRGLFGDAWLVCTLTSRERGVATEQRTSEWCVSVLEAART